MFIPTFRGPENSGSMAIRPSKVHASAATAAEPAVRPPTALTAGAFAGVAKLFGTLIVPPNGFSVLPTGEVTRCSSGFRVAGGGPPGVETARVALDSGLRQVGVIRSDDFSSLHPGYFVVFSGVYPTNAAAQEGIAAARDAGYNPYVRPITQ